jgi:hypothetical protein
MCVNHFREQRFQARTGSWISGVFRNSSGRDFMFDLSIKISFHSWRGRKVLSTGPHLYLTHIYTIFHHPYLHQLYTEVRCATYVRGLSLTLPDIARENDSLLPVFVKSPNTYEYISIPCLLVGTLQQSPATDNQLL